MAENVNVATGAPATPSTGSVGLQTQVPGGATTVSNAALNTGGIAPGNFIEPDIDAELFRFQSEDTALMSLMLKAKSIKVHSPEVEHYMIDEQRSKMSTVGAVADSTSNFFVLPLDGKDNQIPREYHCLLVKGVDGYTPDGEKATPGKDLMLFVTGRDTTTGNPVCRAVNGPRANAASPCTVPAIPAGSEVVVLANSMYETQKEVDPDLIVPQPHLVYLQKRGMNQIVSDYFDAQKKHIPFSQALIAEQSILNFKRAGNRTLWAGRPGKMAVNVPKLGQQYVYFTEGIRWQFVRELQQAGKWTIEKLIALAKMFYTGEDVPKSALLLAGKNLLENIQCIDFSKHPEVKLAVTTNPIGWSVTRIHTVFGDIDIKREPTLDTLGWSNSGALIGEDRLVHYIYSTQHEFNDRVQGEEATRKGIVVWDALALKGACHLWIDGEADEGNAGATVFVIWDKDTAPAGDELVPGRVYQLTQDVKGVGQAGQSVQWVKKDGDAEGKWVPYNGYIVAGE